MNFNLIPFGLEANSGTLVDIADVPRGSKCGCICPACKTPLVARQGEEKEWHFAHASRKVYEKTQKECEFSFYLSVRMMARQIIDNEFKIKLPEYRDSVSQYGSAQGYSVHESFLITEAKEIFLSNVAVEAIFEGVAVDLVGYINDFKFVVYFTHPGRAVPQELESPSDHHSGVMTIALDELRNTIFRQVKNKNQSYQSALIEYLSNDVSSKQWVFHPRYQRCHQQALERLEEKVKSDAREKKVQGRKQVPAGRRVLFECVMCKTQWQGFLPGGNKCLKCNTHLYTRDFE
ncbi:MAG: competence protein CoiA [Gammaproteobacteria bacterium]|nr:competence protein CoiA [Gammaproteobacteria bacterium]